MLFRALIHIKNIYGSLRWVFSDYYAFKSFLESRGYYSVCFYKIWLWKENARYFKVFNDSGRCFFLKLKDRTSIERELFILSYIGSIDIKRICFYPQIFDSNSGYFSYNVYEDLEGMNFKKFSGDKVDILNQIIQCLRFFKNVKVVHRDIRPHNILIVGRDLKILDYEHCALDHQVQNSGLELNKEFRVSSKVWDDAFSFKKMIDSYWNDSSVINTQAYKKINDMIGGYEYKE